MDTTLFIIAKLVGFLIRIESWGVVSIGVIWISLVLGRQRIARAVSLFLLLCLTALSIFPVGDIALRQLEKVYSQAETPHQVDGIVVLGGSEDVTASVYWSQPQLNGGADRIIAAMALAQKFPEARVILTGGSGRLRDANGISLSEAEIARQIFKNQGLDLSRVYLESSSRNTAENARASLKIAQPVAGDVWVLITSAFHMPRSMQTFRKVGWQDLTPYPVDFRTRGFVDGMGWNLLHNISLLNTAISELVGLLALRLLK